MGQNGDNPDWILDATPMKLAAQPGICVEMKCNAKWHIAPVQGRGDV